MSRPIDKEFEDADDIGVLDISGRNLRQFPVIPGDLLDLNYVFEADLAHNRFDRLPKEVISCKALVKLNCHHNSIRWMPPELNLLINLKEIDFSRNFLPSIPNEVCHMNLYSVNLSNNRLLSIPHDIGALKNLQCLDLSCNSLKELPESLYTLGHLRHLNIHRNELRDISEDIAQLGELRHLDVSCNYLIRLPVSLRHMDALQEFSADQNPLEYPPPQVCVRGLVHLCKYLEVLEKKGSDHHLFQSYQRDESLRRRNERAQKKSSTYRPLSMSTPVQNGGEIGLMDEMANLVNKTFGEKDGERTPTGSLHWSVAQYMSSSEKSLNQSKEEYREAAHLLYMQQEGSNKSGSGRTPQPCPSSPAGSSSLDELSITPTSTLPKRKSDENVYRSSTGEVSSRTSSFAGRSLSNEKFPRSGSWNSHMRIPSPVLPSKYVAADRTSEEKNRSEQKSAGTPPGLSSKSESQLGSAEKTPTKKPSPTPNKSQKKSPRSKRPAPLDTSKKQQNGDKGNDSDRDGSLTPTNESPPPSPLEQSEEPTTPKDEDDETFSDLPNSAAKTKKVNKVNKSVSLNSQVEVIPPSTRRPSKPLPLPPSTRNSTSSLPPQSPDIIQDLDGSPPSLRRLPSLSEVETEQKEKDKVQVPPDGKWGRLASPRRRKEKDVFKFLKETDDTSYTVRRQQMQINIMLEKNQHVKKAVENLVGVELSDDLGEWVMDGVVLCKVVNTLHPGTIATIHTPPQGQSLSRIKQTINISAFINACKSLKVPEEELCSAGDIIELKDPLRVITCLQRVLETKPGNLI